MDFYDHVPGPQGDEPDVASPVDAEETEHGWLYDHRRGVCLTVLVTWLAMVALAASLGDESSTAVSALTIGSILFFLLVMPVVSVVSLIGSPPLGPEDAAIAVPYNEDAVKLPLWFLRRWVARAVGTFGFPFGVVWIGLVALGFGVDPDADPVAFKIFVGALAGSVGLAAFVGITSYPSFLLPQAYRAFYGRRTWIDRLRKGDGEDPEQRASAWATRRP